MSPELEKSQETEIIKIFLLWEFTGETKPWAITANATSFSKANNGDTKRNDKTFLIAWHFKFSAIGLG